MSRQEENKFEYLRQGMLNGGDITAPESEFIQQDKMFVGKREKSQQPMVQSLPPLIRLPYVRIVEQPASKALRFRYECEGRCAGSLPGVSSTTENKTFPTIQIIGHRGRAMVVVSCVTKDEPHRPHPHNLVGREGCSRGVCTIEVPTDTMTAHFSNLGIQCVKKKDIGQSLKIREQIRVDPFRTGFEHRNHTAVIDLNVVRLCFQVFLEGRPGKFSVPLPPVVSDPIFDKKAMLELNITKLSQCVSYVDGGSEIILLCEKVTKEDIQVRFSENESKWEVFVNPLYVHKQTAICFKTPKYRVLDIEEPVRVSLQLHRPSDGATSKAVPFEMLPLEAEPGALKRKRQNMDDPNTILKNLQNGYNFAYFYEDFHPFGAVSPGYDPNLPQQNYIGVGPTVNNSDVLSPSTSTSNSQSPVWNIPPNTSIVPECDNLLQGFDSRLNSDEVDATLKIMVEDSTPLPDIKSLSLSDISPN